MYTGEGASVLQTDSQKTPTCLVTQNGQWLQKPALGTGQEQKVKALTSYKIHSKIHTGKERKKNAKTAKREDLADYFR